MGRLARKLQTLIPLPTNHLAGPMSFSRLPRPHCQQKSPGPLKRLRSAPREWPSPASGLAPKGHLPIRVVNSPTSDGLLYFIKAEHLGHPLILDLLQRAADEFGYSRVGALQVVCDASVFEDILQTLSFSR